MAEQLGSTVRLPAQEGQIYEVPAQLVGAFAIHRTQGEASWFVKRWPWRVTHAATGLGMRSVATRKAAIRLAETLAPLADWGAITAQNPSLPREQMAAIRQAINEAG